MLRQAKTAFAHTTCECPDSTVVDIVDAQVTSTGLVVYIRFRCGALQVWLLGQHPAQATAGDRASDPSRAAS